MDEDGKAGGLRNCQKPLQVPKFWTAFDSMVDVMFLLDLMIQFLFTYTSEPLGRTWGFESAKYGC